MGVKIETTPTFWKTFFYMLTDIISQCSAGNYLKTLLGNDLLKKSE